MRILLYVPILALSLLLGNNLQSQTQWVGPNNGDWFDQNNWQPNVLPGPGNDALIGGGVTVVVGSPLNVNFNINAFGNISATAAVTVATGGSIESSGTFAISSTGSLTNNGTLKNFGTMTFAGTAGFTNANGANFTNSNSFTLQTTLVNQGTITNNGTIDAANGTLQSGGAFNNNQVLATKSLTINASSSFTNNFGAVLNITGATGLLQMDGSFTNNGSVTASGVMTVNGTFNNNVTLNVATATVLTVNAGAQLTNAGNLTNSGILQNYGTLTNGQNFVNKGEVNNFATFNNNNLVDNQTGASFFNRPGGTLGMGFGSKIGNGGTFDNKNAINSFGLIENNGTFLNNGTLLSFGGSQLLNKSTFTNNNSLSTNDIVTNDGTFTNNGSVNVNGGSVWSNTGTFTNATVGTVTVVQDFNNKPTGKLINNGTFRNGVRTLNEGSFVNNAYLHNPGDFTNATGATLTNSELFFLEAGNLLNAGTFANTKKTLVNDCSSVKNTGTINNTGGTFELRGILFQKGTITGNAVNNQGGYVHTGATSAAPTVCKNGSFGADINGDIKVYANSLVSFANFDSCANIVYLANYVARPVFKCSDIGSVKNVNLTVRTRLNDSLTCVAQVTPVDLLEPQFNTCPKDQVIFTPNSNVTATWTAPTATDNCSTVTMTTTHTPGSSFPVGITGVTYTAKDIYNNINNCQFRIDVRQTPPGSNCTGDTAGPAFTGCPTNQTLQALGTLTPATWTPPTPSDNCKPINLTATHVPGQGFPVGTTTVTYTAKDGNNNSSTCSFNVTVTATNPCQNDTQKPVVFGCPANIWLPTNTNINGAVAMWSAPGAGDNCGVTSFTASHVEGSVFPVGTTTVTYTAKDAANNTATCSFLITVGADPCPGDVAAPTISGCPANISLVTAGNSANATWTAPTANDPCAPVTVNATHASGATFPLGVTQVTYQFSDKKGNKSTCSFTVTVQNSCSMDNVPPVITGCPANITVAASGTNGAPATWTAPMATDNCGLSAFTSSFLPGANFPIGTTTVVYTAIDVKGNASNCSFNVNVVTGPNCTANAAPINNTTGVNPASVTLSWTTAANASSYDVYLGTTNPPTTVVATNVTGTSTTVTNLASGTAYFWYVVPKNAAGSATGCASSATKFTTSGSSGGGNNCISAPTTVSSRVNTGSDDAEEKISDGKVGLGSSDLELGYDGSTAQIVGMRFTQLDIPQGAIIQNAYIEFEADETNSGTTNLVFRGQNSDNAPTFLSTNYNISSRAKTTASVNWNNVPAWNTVNEKHQSPDLSKIIQEIVNRPGWAPGKSMVMLVQGSGERAAESYNGESANAPLLVVTYTKQISLPPTAVCKNITLQLPAPGQSVQISGQDIDGGSMANCGTITSLNASPNSFSQAGTYTTTLTVTNSLGLSATCTATVTVTAPTCSGKVTGFSFDKVDGSPLFALQNGGTYSVNSLPSSYNIEAFTSGTSESALFTLTGPVSITKVENYVPYDVAGTGGSLSLTPGNYTLNVKLYGQDDAQGSICSQTTINFSISAACSVSNTVCEANQDDAGWQNLSNCAVTACAGSKLALSVNPNGLPSYQWSGPNGFSTNGNSGGDALISSNITSAQAGTYTVVLTDANGCTASKSIQVTVNNCITCDNVTNGGSIGKTCASNQVSLTNAVAPSGGSGNLEYMWISGTVDCNPDNMTPVAGANGPALTIAPTSVKTYFIRCSRRAGCTLWDGESNCITVNASECAPIGPCTDNLLVNSGFESGTAGWTWMQNAGTTTSSPYAGTRSLKICSGAGGISQSMPALPGEEYTASVFAKVSSTTASIGLRFYDKNWVELSVPAVAVTATSFTQYTVSGTAPVNAAFVEAWAWKNNNGCFYADAFCLTSTAGYPACTNNLLSSKNPGFESNFSSWEWTNNATITTSNVRSGSKAAQVCSSAGGGGVQISATPGATYSLQLWAKISGTPSWAGASITFYNSSGTKIGNDISRTITSSDWALYLIQGVAPINAKYVQFSFWKDSNGCLYVDDFCATSKAGSNCNDKILFVVGDTRLNSGDEWAKKRLELLGLNVTVKSATSASTSDASGKGLIVISSTVNSGDVGSKFTNVAVPVLTWESYLLDDLKMTDDDAQEDYGQNASYNSLTITDPTHPLSAGLSGNVQVLTSGHYMRWGWTTKASAAKVAKVAGQEEWYGIFGFDKGAAMDNGFAAPERRVSLFLDDVTPAMLTAQGEQLFDAAIEWAIRCNLNNLSGVEVAVRNSEVETNTATIEPSASIQVFPNPAEDKIFLEFGEGYNNEAIVRLFDINGRAMKEWQIEASNDPVELQLDGLRSGQYLLWIASKGKAPVSKRLIITTTK